MLAIGITVTAAPAPKPAAVRPAAEAALVREPLQRVADAGAVDAAGAEAGDHRGGIELGQRARERVDDPAEAGEDGAARDHGPRAEAVDEPALDRHEPGLHDHEDRERELDGRQAQ
jgi:hypothetical protein